MNSIIIDLDFLHDLFIDFYDDEIGEVICFVLDAIHNPDETEDINFNTLVDRDRRILARILMSEYRQAKRDQSERTKNQ